MSTLSGGAGEAAAAPNNREVNKLTLTVRSRLIRRAAMLVAALLAAAVVAIPGSGVALAQTPPEDGDDIRLVNKDRQMVERKKAGDFVARPVFSRPTEVLY